MSSFIEFQAVVLDKLCSIENRLSAIEEVLGISRDEKNNFTCESEIIVLEQKNESGQSLKNDINDFQNKLADIKSLFSASEY